MERYLEVSREIMAILGGYTPRLQQISVDEAFLEMTGTERLMGAPAQVARRLKDEVRARTGLAVSVGIGPHRYIAKLAPTRASPTASCG
jgi:DNA polymerase-4